MPPRSNATLSETAETAPRQRDRHLQSIAEKGWMGWQKASGCIVRSRVEAGIGCYKQVIDDGLRSRKYERRATEVAIAVWALNRMLELGRPIPSASNEVRWVGLLRFTRWSVQNCCIRCRVGSIAASQKASLLYLNGLPTFSSGARRRAGRTAVRPPNPSDRVA